MSIQAHAADAARADDLSSVTFYQDQPPASTASAAVGIAGRNGRLANLWPITMVSLGLGLTLAWTGFLGTVLYWGLARLV